MKTRFVFLLYVFFMYSLIEVFAQTDTVSETKRIEDTIPELESMIKDVMEREKIPGLSIAIYKDDYLWSEGYGFSDIENNIRAKPETSYILASVMKPMTALAIVRLENEGKLDFDAEIQQYLPYYPKKKWPVTVRQVLGHLSGIGCKEMQWEEYMDKITYKTEEALEFFMHCGLLFEPGSRYEYSSFGYNVLGAIVEAVSGESYEHYMTESIWKPLGMNSTSLDSDAIIPNRVRGMISLMAS